MKLIKRATEILSEKGIETPRLDAELLMCHTLGWENRVKLYTKYDRPLSSDEVETYRQLIKQRVKGEPVAYITGRKEFFGFQFKLTKDVLIPRPETELLVEQTLEIAKNISETPIKIADIGTGSGCIIITLAKLLTKKAEFFATDISEKALDIAKENAKIHNVNVHFFKTDILENLNENFTIVVSNPPYISFKDKRVEKSVTKYEPHCALFGGEKGTEIIEKLTKQAYSKLKKGGYLLVEFGEGQAGEVKKIFEASGFKNIQVLKDLAGKERIILGEK
ncbi:peptide chain release factor N(5)-glutamine methyltransferase [Desulfurobacterium atlanticum]|uniref:Release factor glutamine methyltransferase n=1 Tax=Desulfurobacterium atlanticum TaxID=240169 RepID=A0A238YAE5_9BACT|nr:peptide chain release factor N(5)-glutamine methyltransferase [Desulfurobacterium atlanticum]SNR67319.1 release factor glutamine methyltransferase [Desulfurobacterium atlanticum]